MRRMESLRCTGMKRCIGIGGSDMMRRNMAKMSVRTRGVLEKEEREDDHEG